MTIQSSTIRMPNYVGNGVTDEFSFSFKILSASHLVVTERDTDGLETTLVLDTDYTVSGVGDKNGGIVTLDSPLPTDHILSISLLVPLTQLTSLRNQTSYYADIHEDAFDYQMRASQQQQEQIDRSVKLAPTNEPDNFDPTLPADIADNPGTAIIVNVSGDGLAMGPTVGDISGAQTAAEEALASAELAEEWATKTDDLVEATDYSSKEWAQGIQTRGAASGGSSKDWATYTGGTVDDTEFSAKQYALDAADEAQAAADSAAAAAQSAAEVEAAVPTGGTTGQVLKKASNDDFDTEWTSDTDTGITELTGEVTAGPGNGSQAATLDNAAVIAKVLTGHTAGSGTVAATDSISQAIQKLDGNDGLKVDKAGDTMTGNLVMDNNQEIRFEEASGNGDNYIALKGPADLAGDFTNTLPAASTTLVGTDTQQALTNKDIDGGSASDTSRITIPKDTKTNLDGLTRKEGTIVYATDLLKPFYDDGINLREVGSGSGQGGINYLDNPDAETNADGSAVYADAAGAEPVDGDGGSPTVTITRNTSNPLRGSADFLFTKDAADRQGEGFTFTPRSFDLQDYEASKPVYVSFDYKTSADYASGDIILYVYDVTTGALIGVVENGFDGELIASEAPSQFTGIFYTVAGASDYRLIFHVATTNASAYTVQIDNVKVSPQVLVPGVILENAEQFSISIQGVTTNPTKATSPDIDKAVKRRNGDHLEISYTYAHSATTGANSGSGVYLFQLPDGLSPDLSKMPNITSLSAHRNVRGFGSAIIGSTEYVASLAWQQDSGGKSGLYVRLFPEGGGSCVNLDSAIGFASSATFQLSFTVNIPIEGWSSGAQLSTNELFLSIAKMRASGNPASATTTNPIIFPTLDYSTGGGSYNVSTGLYTAPKSGYYRVHGVINTNDTATLYIYVNSTQTALAGRAAGAVDVFEGTIFANKGDTISVRPVGATLDVGTNSLLYVEEIPDFHTFSVAEDKTQHEVWVHGGTSYGSTANKIYIFTTVERNIGTAITYATSAVNGDSFTINERGLYHIDFGFNMSAVDNGGISLNAPSLTTGIQSVAIPNVLSEGEVAGNNFGLTTSASVWLEPGDVIRGHTGGTGRVASKAGCNFLRIVKIK